MGITALSGKDTLIFDFNGDGQGVPLVDLANGDVATIEYEGDSVAMETGKNGNTIYNQIAKAKNATVTLRVIRGSKDDKTLHSERTKREADFASSILISAQFIRPIGDGSGNRERDVYSASGGVFSNEVNYSDNVEGDAEQSVAVYTLKFSEIKRNIS